MPDDILTIPDIAREWGVHPITVKRWIRSYNGQPPRLPSFRTEGRFRRGVWRSVAESILGERPTKTGG